METNVARPSQDEPELDELLGPAETQTLLRAATRAPSLHNSQPWRFAVGPRHVELYVDAARQLRNADPAGRSLLISCGAALFNLRLASEHLGFHPRIRVLPDDAAPTLVAVATVDRRHPCPGALDFLSAHVKPSRRAGLLVGGLASRTPPTSSTGDRWSQALTARHMKNLPLYDRLCGWLHPGIQSSSLSTENGSK